MKFTVLLATVFFLSRFSSRNEVRYLLRNVIVLSRLVAVNFTFIIDARGEAFSISRFFRNPFAR